MRWIFIPALAGLLAAIGFALAATRPDAKTAQLIVALPPSDLPDYADACEALEATRVKLATRFGQASPKDRAAILIEARNELEGALFGKLAPHWMGTTWDFNGTSQTPGEGGIACGYFVSTLLRDAGFELERVRLAQQASGHIIRSLTSRKNTRRLVGKSFDEFLAQLKEEGPGVFVIGLDYHVGFIVQIDGKEARFVHSDGMENKCVVSEPARIAPVLKRSNWREFANITADEALIGKWLTGEEVVTHTGS